MRILLIFLCFILYNPPIFSQSYKYFSQHYGDSIRNEYGKTAIQLTNSEYLVVGFSLGTIFDRNAYMVKINSIGNVVWEQQYGDSLGYQYFWYGLVTNDGYYIGAGIEYVFADSLANAYIAKIDSGGDLILAKTIGDSMLSNAASQILQTYDGGFAIGGWGMDSTNTYAIPNIIKLDSAFNTTWNKKYLGVVYSNINGLKQTPDSGFIFTAKYTPQFSNVGDIWLVKTDKNGDIEWDQKYDIVTNEDGIDVQPTNNGGYVIIGSVRNDTLSYSNGIIIKTNGSGNIQWQKKIIAKNGSEAINSHLDVIHQLSDNSYVAAGQIAKDSSITSINYDALLIKPDSSGNELWRRNHEVTPDTGNCGPSLSEFSYDMNSTTDEGYIITGLTIICNNNSNTWSQDAFLIKTNCLGFTGPPAADFTYTVANDTVVTFTNLSASAGYFTWYFGDGDTLYATERDTFKSPVHVYPDSGCFTVTLVAEACGEYDTLVRQIALITPPQAGFGYTVANDTVFFTNQSAGANTFLWLFGDGDSAASTDPMHIYAATGAYYVSLIAESCGLRDTLIDSVYVCIAPDAAFTYTQTGDTAAFTNQSANAQNYFWDFGDGNTDTVQNPMHTYVAEGAYQVCLTAGNICGSDTVCDSVVVTSVGIGNAEDQQVFVHAYPNPFSNKTGISFSIPESSRVILNVFNISGGVVATLFDQDAEKGKIYNLEFNSTGLPGGVYFYNLLTDEGTYTNKLVIIKQ